MYVTSSTLQLCHMSSFQSYRVLTWLRILPVSGPRGVGEAGSPAVPLLCQIISARTGLLVDLWLGISVASGGLFRLLMDAVQGLIRAQEGLCLGCNIQRCTCCVHGSCGCLLRP